MAWTWDLGSTADSSDEIASQPTAGFPNQAEAETWIGEVWRDLLESGISEVVLLEDERRVYGPMSLRPLE